MANLTAARVRALKPKDKTYTLRGGACDGFHIRVQPTGTKTYYVTWARGHHYKIGTVDELSPSEARELAIRYKRDRRDGKTEIRVGAIPTLKEYIQGAWSDWARSNDKKTRAATRQRWLTNGGGLLNLRLNEITPLAFEKWRGRRLKKVAKNTADRDTTDLLSMLNRAVALELISESPLSARSVGGNIQKFKIPDKRNRWLGHEKDPGEKERLLHAISAHQWLERAVLFTIHTGLRKSELHSLEWSDAAEDLSEITVRWETTKSKREKVIPLSETAREILRGINNREGKIFPSVYSLRRHWRRAREEAGVKDFRWHDLRHTFASWLVQRGVELGTLKELMGHASIDQTMRYAHIADEQKKKAVKVLDG